MRLILASTSRYRAELLARTGLAFECIAPTFDEAAFEHRFTEMEDHAFAVTLASGKADSVIQQLGGVDPRDGACVLAADQLAILGGSGGIPRRLLHKPGDADLAVAQLRELSGRTHRLVTAVVLVQLPSGVRMVAVDEVGVQMRGFAEQEARAYVERYAPLDCVGSYRVEDAGITLMAAITGADPTSIMGLPMLSVCDLLRRAGLLPA